LFSTYYLSNILFIFEKKRIFSKKQTKKDTTIARPSRKYYFTRKIGRQTVAKQGEQNESFTELD